MYRNSFQSSWSNVYLTSWHCSDLCFLKCNGIFPDSANQPPFYWKPILFILIMYIRCCEKHKCGTSLELFPDKIQELNLWWSLQFSLGKSIFHLKPFKCLLFNITIYNSFLYTNGVILCSLTWHHMLGECVAYGSWYEIRNHGSEWWWERTKLVLIRKGRESF